MPPVILPIIHGFLSNDNGNKLFVLCDGHFQALEMGRVMSDDVFTLLV